MGQWKRKKRGFWSSPIVVVRLVIFAVVLAALAALYLRAEPTQAPVLPEPEDTGA